jgi:plasmid stabilization system protein ParE
VTAVHFSGPAAQDLSEAVRWYDQQRAGLGGELFDAAQVAVERIREHPESGAPRPTRPEVRQLRLQKFPYNLVYQIRSDGAVIVAVAHTSRRPDYWSHRVS